MTELQGDVLALDVTVPTQPFPKAVEEGIGLWLGRDPADSGGNARLLRRSRTGKQRTRRHREEGATAPDRGSGVQPHAFLDCRVRCRSCQRARAARSSSCDRLRKLASMKMTAILANSEGWNLKNPRSIHRFAPKTVVPKNMTAMSSAIANQ